MRTIVSLTFCFLLLFAATARAESSVAVFNVQKVASECDALRDAKSVLEKKFGTQKQALEKQRETIEKKAAALKGKGTEKQQAELNKMHREYTEKAQAFMRVVQADELRVRQDIDTVIVDAAKELAAKKGYSLILDSAAAIYMAPGLDITDEMLTATNEIWQTRKAAAPAVRDDKDDKGGKDAAKPAAKPAKSGK